MACLGKAIGPHRPTHDDGQEARHNAECTEIAEMRKVRDYRMARWLFVRMMGIVYLIAFISLWRQIGGLLGSNGISPAGDFLASIGPASIPERFLTFPTLCWLNSSDFFLHLLCLSGTICSLLLIFGVLPPLVLACLWTLHLSLFTVGQDLLQLQWDGLLLEVGFLAILLAPMQVFPGLPRGKSPSPMAIWLLRLVLFRLMFTAGLTRFLDFAAQGRGALTFAFDNQPVPTWLAWHAHQTPQWLHEGVGLYAMLILMATPLLIFMPRHARAAGAAVIAGFFLFITAVGQYYFVALVALALCALLLDDDQWRALLPQGLASLVSSREPAPEMAPLQSFTLGFIASLLIPLGVARLAEAVGHPNTVPAPFSTVMALAEPFHLVNEYNLLPSGSPTRSEIIVEGSYDGRSWQPYELKCQPSDAHSRPFLFQPALPRLDSQMQAAAGSELFFNPWMLNLMERLLEGSPEVVALFDSNPFPKVPPKHVRAMRYDYRFSDVEALRREGIWWRRELVGVYCPVISGQSSVNVASAESRMREPAARSQHAIRRAHSSG